jgi:hypothetical protein
MLFMKRYARPLGYDRIGHGRSNKYIENNLEDEHEAGKFLLVMVGRHDGSCGVISSKLHAGEAPHGYQIVTIWV